MKQNINSQIVNLCEHGKKKDALKLIYSETLEAVFKYVYSRVGEKDTTEDIVSDTYLTLWNIIEKYDGSSKPSTFVIGVARNKIMQYWTDKRNDNTNFDEEFYIIEDEEEDKDKHEKEEEILEEKLDTVLKKLSEKERALLTLRFIDCESVKSTAQTMNITESNVKVIQHRALKKAAKIADELFKLSSYKCN